MWPRKGISGNSNLRLPGTIIAKRNGANIVVIPEHRGGHIRVVTARIHGDGGAGRPLTGVNAHYGRVRGTKP
jgi:hypothetical protein